MHDIVEIDAPFAPLKQDEIVPFGPGDSDGGLVLPIPADAPPSPETHFDLGQPSASWTYRDATGAMIFKVLRFDRADGSKEFRPLTLWRSAHGLCWHWKSVPAPRPLYNLDDLAMRPDAPVVVCEGEKSADAASEIFPGSVAVTAPSGANAADKADWTVLRRRKVVIWPDDDAAGHSYAVKVGDMLMALDCDVSIIDACALARIAAGGCQREPSKKRWDAADALSEWHDTAALRQAVSTCTKAFGSTKGAPAYLSFGKFSMTAKGLYAERKCGRGKNSETEMVRVSGPFEILGRGRDPHGRSWGRFLRWRDPDGREHERFVSDESLHGEVSSVCGLLASDGLEIVRAQQREFLNYLLATKPDGRVTVVPRTGWHEIEGENVFVLPGETIGRQGIGRVLLDGAAHGPYESKGTLAEWQDGVAAPAGGHTVPTLAISAAFAGPLLHLAGLEGGGLNLFGQSSRGKTTSLQAAASVWGRGTTPGYVRAWRATANGLEAAAAQSTDTVMVLDELSMVDGRDAAQALYGLANGQGKQRARRDGSPRDPKSWRVLFLSSGELPIDAKLSETPGRKARAGQLVRALDVPADRGKGFGVFDHGGPDGDAGALARDIKLAAVDGEALRRLISEFVAAIIPGDADGQIERAAQRFGLIAIAGELATSFGIVPWQEGAARKAVAWALERLIELRGGTGPAEARQAIESVRLFIEAHGDARFAAAEDPDGRSVANRAGFRKGSGAEQEWWFLPQVWRDEVCAGHDARLVARVLAERGMLRRQAEGLTCKVRIGNATLRAYVVTAAILMGERDNES